MKKLVRSSRNKVIAGICAGLGEYFNIDVTVVRLIMVVLGLFSFGSIVLAYLIAMLIVPFELE